MSAQTETLRLFAAEMSGLITDMGDVPDPGLDDLPGMSEAIRSKFDALAARVQELEAALDRIAKAHAPAGHLQDIARAVLVSQEPT